MFNIGMGIGIPFNTPVGGSSPVAGNATPSVSRTTGKMDRNTNKAAFVAVYPVDVPGYAFSDLYFHWTWADASGSHYEQGVTKIIDIVSDGSASYVSTLRLYIQDGATGNYLNANGSVMGAGVPSGEIALTVTNNASATLYTVSKAGSAITVVGPTTYYANEVTGNNSNSGLDPVLSPKADLYGIINAVKANNQVWSIGAGTYAMSNGIPAGGLTNFEVSAAIGQTAATVILNFINGYRWFGGNSPSDHRCVNITLTSTAYDAGNRVFDSTSTLPTANITIRNCITDKLNDFLVNSLNNGLYIINNTVTMGSYFYIAGGRSEYVGFKSNTVLTQTSYGATHEAQVRPYNHRYWVFEGNNMTQAGGEKACLRMIPSQDPDPSYRWDIAGVSTESYGSVKENTFLNLTATTAFTPVSLSYDADVGGVAAHANIVFENNILYSPGGSACVSISVDPTDVRDVIVRNNRMGNDYGAGVFDTPIRGVAMATVAGRTRTRIVTINNDIITLMDPSAGWATAVYLQSSLLPISADVTDNEFVGNLLILNAFNPGGDGNISWNGPRAGFAASMLARDNTYAKTDSYGSSASTQTAFQSDDTGSRTLVNYLAAGTETNSQSFTLADASLRSTHYDFTNYRTRVTSSWLSDMPRNTQCRYDYLGNLRNTTSTPGRYDPNGTAYTI